MRSTHLTMARGYSNEQILKEQRLKLSLCGFKATQGTPKYLTRTKKTYLGQRHREMCVLMSGCTTARTASPIVGQPSDRRTP